MIARATASDAPRARRADRYAEREPPNRTAMIVRSSASTRDVATGCPGDSTSRAKSALSATWVSSVSADSTFTSSFEIVRPSSLQRVAGGSAICPSSREALKPAPAASGPSQSFGSRAHRYTHAAFALSASAPAVSNVPQPQLTTLPIFSSDATCLAASVWSFAKRSHVAVGCRPSRPPLPGPDWKPIDETQAIRRDARP